MQTAPNSPITPDTPIVPSAGGDSAFLVRDFIGVVAAITLLGSQVLPLVFANTLRQQTTYAGFTFMAFTLVFSWIGCYLPLHNPLHRQPRVSTGRYLAYAWVCLVLWLIANAIAYVSAMFLAFGRPWPQGDLGSATFRGAFYWMVITAFGLYSNSKSDSPLTGHSPIIRGFNAALWGLFGGIFMAFGALISSPMSASAPHPLKSAPTSSTLWQTEPVDDDGRTPVYAIADRLLRLRMGSGTWDLTHHWLRRAIAQGALSADQLRVIVELDADMLVLEHDPAASVINGRPTLRLSTRCRTVIEDLIGSATIVELGGSVGPLESISGGVPGEGRLASASGTLPASTIEFSRFIGVDPMAATDPVAVVRLGLINSQGAAIATHDARLQIRAPGASPPAPGAPAAAPAAPQATPSPAGG